MRGRQWLLALPLALACASCAAPISRSSPSASPAASATLLALLPAGATILDSQPLGGNLLAVLAGVPGAPGTPSIASGPTATDVFARVEWAHGS
jgi:hypothetical protein